MNSHRSAFKPWLEGYLIGAVMATIITCVAGVPWSAAAQTVSVNGTADVSSIQQQIDELRAQQEVNTAAIAGLKAQGGSDSDGSDSSAGGTGGTGGDTSGGNSVGTSGGGGGGGKETDLWLNVSHLRYTPVVAYNVQDGKYEVTDPRFVELMSKWSGIRYLNWTGQLRKDRNWTWGNRVTQADADQWDSTGVPLEAIIAIANATRTHVWWCAPQQADLDYMKQAGRLFATTLDPDLHVVIEIGNEVWQSDRGWHYNDLADGDFGKRMELYAQDSAAKFKAFTAGVSGVGFPRDRLTRVIGGQLHNIGVLKSNALKHIDAADYDAISCSGYFGNAPDNWINGSGGIKASLRGVADHAELADQYGKRLLIYEINQHIDVGTDNTEYVDRDDVIAGVKQVIDTARGLGVETIAVYSGAGRSYKNAPFPVYTPNYTPRKIVTELGWPTLN